MPTVSPSFPAILKANPLHRYMLKPDSKCFENTGLAVGKQLVRNLAGSATFVVNVEKQSWMKPRRNKSWTPWGNGDSLFDCAEADNETSCWKSANQPISHKIVLRI